MYTDSTITIILHHRSLYTTHSWSEGGDDMMITKMQRNEITRYANI